MKKYFLIIVIALSSISCKSQQATSANVKFKIENKEILKYPLSIRFTSSRESGELLKSKLEKNEVDTLLKCKTPYVIRIQSEGIYSQNLNFYNTSCKDTVITVALEPIKVVTHERDSSGVIIHE